jgi:hypothetical protein
MYIYELTVFWSSLKPFHFNKYSYFCHFEFVGLEFLLDLAGKHRKGKRRKRKISKRKMYKRKTSKWLIYRVAYKWWNTAFFRFLSYRWSVISLILIPHILMDTWETETLPRLRGWTYRTIFVKISVLKIFWKGVVLCVISLLCCFNKRFVKTQTSVLSFDYPVFVRFSQILIPRYRSYVASLTCIT